MLPTIPLLLLSSVVGGTPAKPGAWPDAVAVLSSTGACTGTLIAPDVVLTAGHCIALEPTVVVVDTVDYGQPGGEAIRVTSTRAYPDWENSYDVGVVVLEHAAKVKPRTVAAACTLRSGLTEGAQVHVVGFGLTAASGVGENTQLHVGTIPVLDPRCEDPEVCMPAVAPGGELVAGGEGIDSCFGDSGGPLYLDTSAGPVLAGVVSRAYAQTGPPCGRAGIYVRADRVVAWVERVTHRAVTRSRCTGAADQITLATTDDNADSAGGGCRAGGSAGPAGLALAVAIAGARRRRRRADPPERRA